MYANLSLQEGQTRVINLPSDQYDAPPVARMIAYIYQNTYDDVKELSPHEPQSWEDPSWHVDTAGADYIHSRMLANAAVHRLADYFYMPDLQAFSKARFRMLALEYWKPTLPHIPEIVHAVFGTQGNDHTDLQGPVLERCVPIYKNITTDPACIESMATYPTFTRALLQAVGKHLEDENTLLTNQKIQLADEVDDLTLARNVEEYHISAMHSALNLVHEKLNNIIQTQCGFTSRGRGGGGRVHERGNAAFKEEIRSIIQILLPHVEDETQEREEEYQDAWLGGGSRRLEW